MAHSAIQVLKLMLLTGYKNYYNQVFKGVDSFYAFGITQKSVLWLVTKVWCRARETNLAILCLSCTSTVNFFSLFTTEYDPALKLKVFSSVNVKIRINSLTCACSSLKNNIYTKKLMFCHWFIIIITVKWYMKCFVYWTADFEIKWAMFIAVMNTI